MPAIEGISGLDRSLPRVEMTACQTNIPTAQPWAQRVLDRRSGPKGNMFKSIYFDRWSTQAFNLGWHAVPFQGCRWKDLSSRWSSKRHCSLARNDNHSGVETTHIPKIFFNLSLNSAIFSRLNSPIAYNILLESTVFTMLGRMKLSFLNCPPEMS